MADWINSLDLDERQYADISWPRALTANFRHQLKVYWPTYLIVCASFILAFFIGLKVGLSLDFAGVIGTLKTMGMVLVVLSLTFLVIIFVRIARQRSDSPSADLIKSIQYRFRNPAKISRILHILLLFSFASVAFAVLKSSIALLNPFSWDLFFMDLEKTIHFGRLPHEWLGWITASPILLFGLNFFYNLWFFVIFVFLYVYASRYGSTRAGLQFYHAFFLSWVFIGFFAATYFSSGGPCYFERLGLGAEYNGLMAELHAANEHYKIWALGTQDMLWDGQEGLREGRLGISAFPSMHVAIAVIMALGASAVSRIWGVFAWVFAFLIFLSSVVLGWHYAVDGYASIAMVLILWWVSGKLADWVINRQT